MLNVAMLFLECCTGEADWWAAYLVCGLPEGCYERQVRRVMGRELLAGEHPPWQSITNAGNTVRSTAPSLLQAVSGPHSAEPPTCQDPGQARAAAATVPHPCNGTCFHPVALFLLASLPPEPEFMFELSLSLPSPYWICGLCQVPRKGERNTQSTCLRV